MKIRQKINYRLGKVAQGGIWIYQLLLSPDKGLPSPWLKGKICSHVPHCSAYGKECFERYGFWPGFLYTIDRISSCTPKAMHQYDPSHYKVVFFSSAPIGVPFLEQLARDKRFEITGVVCAPDKPSGRGMEVKPNIIAQTALQIKEQRAESRINGEFPILTPSKINPDKSEEGKEFYEQLKALDADFFVVIAYGKIMPQSILDVPKLGPINVHPSLLPKYRGASPIISALLYNETMTGVTIMHMDAKMDEGDIISSLGFSIDPSWDEADLTHKVTQIGPELLCNTLRDFGKGHLTRKPQDHSKATYATKFTKEDGKIDPRKDSLQTIYNKYRAFYQRPKIFFIHDEKRVIIEKMVFDHARFAGGEKMINENNRLHASIVECLVKPEGKKAMSWEDFARGYLHTK